MNNSKKDASWTKKGTKKNLTLEDLQFDSIKLTLQHYQAQVIGTTDGENNSQMKRQSSNTTQKQKVNKMKEINTSSESYSSFSSNQQQSSFQGEQKKDVMVEDIDGEACESGHAIIQKDSINSFIRKAKTSHQPSDSIVIENSCVEGFREIQKLNIITQQEAVNNFENVLRNYKDERYYVQDEAGPKNFEKEYRAYLESLSDANQIPIFDTKQDLMKPRVIERKLRDSFIRELQKQRKIDNYEVKITPILKQILSFEKYFKNKDFKDTLHPSTYVRIDSYLDPLADDSLSVSLSSAEDRQDELEHLIISVQVDHYSYNKEEQFMIVKTIEEMHDDQDRFNVIQTIRIYKEKVNPELQKLPCNHFKAENEGGPRPKDIKNRISALFKSSKNINISDQRQIYSRGIPRYKMMEQIIVSDSGMMKMTNDKAKMGKFQQPASILYHGNNMFFFQKDFESGTMNYTIQQIDLKKIGTIEQFQKQIKGSMFETNNQLINNNHIFWAQESQTLGKQLIFTDEELEEMEKNKMDFLQNQFIQIVDLDNLQQVQIYSLKAPNKCLSQGIQMPKMRYQTLSFNEIFVKRECPNSKSHFQNNLDQGTEGSNSANTIHFLCFYNSSYMTLQLILDDNLSNQCQKNLVYPYSKSEAANKAAATRRDSKTSALLDFKKMFVNTQLIENNLELHNSGYVIMTKIKCLQNINVLKYKPNARRNKNDRLPYFEYQRAQLETTMEDHNEETEVFAKDIETNKEQDYENVIYFIDENAEIQLVHTKKLFKNMKEQQTGLEEMNDYYRHHINAKIGHTQNSSDRQQVRVTYVKNMLTYEDSRFAGNGLLEYFVKADQAFVSKEQQQQNLNFLVAQTYQDQFLYIYKQNNLSSHLESEQEPLEKQGYNQDLTFEIVKIRHHNYKKDHTKQNDQILRFLQSYQPYQVNQIPQIRINSQYKGQISCWWSINRMTLDRVQQDTQIDLKQEFEKVDGNDATKQYKLEFQEAVIQHMIFETINPPGLYFGINICSQKLIKHMEEVHRLLNKIARIKFYIVPNTYFVKNNYYYVIFELKVFYKRNSQFFFTAENILVKFKMQKSYEAYNARQGNDYILGLDSMVQFFINPSESMDTTDESLESNIIQYKLSEPMKLADYNLFESKFFDYDKEYMENYQRVKMKSKQKQTIFQFEKIVDSKIHNNFVPFLSYQKDILPLGTPQDPNVCIFNNFMLQALYYVQNTSKTFELGTQEDKIKVTTSVVTNPKKIDRMTIQMNNQIQLWRCSDYFQCINGSIIVHYKQSLVFEQVIDRVQILELRVTFNPNGKLKVYPIARTEKLNSCIKSQIHHENLQIIQNKIEKLSESGNKDIFELIKKRDKYYNNLEYRAANAVGLLDFNNNGYLYQDEENDKPTHKDDLVPFNQAYRSPYLNFGYQKQEIDDARCFELVFHTRLHDECIINKIFSKYEVYHMFENMIMIMFKMKPVMIQDFEFLLMHSFQSFDFQIQMQESFFQPQELFIGQTMLDINLNDPSLISDEISKLFRHEQRMREEHQDEQEEELRPLYKGSLFDKLTQNNPCTPQIQQKFQLQAEDYLIVSQDFHFKSQIIRCLDLNAENSYKIIIESIVKANCHKYSPILERDLHKIMSKSEISEIYNFFTVSDFEELEEIKLGTNNLFCNFEQALIHEDLPTVWDKDGLRLPMQRFRDTQNQQDEIIQRIANLVPNSDSSESNIQVQHKFVDFQKVSLGQKIRDIYDFILYHCEEGDADELTKSNLEEFKYTFDNLSLAQLMIQEESNSNFYNLDTVQSIIDSQFDKSSTFFFHLFLFYMITFICPIVIQGVVQIQWVTQMCFAISFISLSFFFMIEVCQMRQVGMQEYLYDFWNIIDSSQFFVFGYLTYIKLYQTPEFDHETTTTEVYLLVFSLGQAFLKGQSFSRIFEDYGFLVRMIGITIKELYPFIGVYTLYTMFFATAYMILQIDLNVQEPELYESTEAAAPKLRRSSQPAYPGVGMIYAYVLYSFRNSIGDLAIPNYDQWLLRGQSEQISQISSYFVVGLAWGIWLVQAMFMVIILLNYLIAVISQAYERVVNQRTIYSYIHKAEINLDYFQIKNQLNKNLKKIKFIVFVEPCNVYIDGEGNWLGFVQAIQKLFQQHDKAAKYRFNKINENVVDQSAKTNRMIKNMKGDITSLKTEMSDIKKMIGQLLNQRSLHSSRKLQNDSQDRLQLPAITETPGINLQNLLAGVKQ